MTDTTHSTKLPIEVTHHILNFLHDDKHTLARCGTVCKAWISPCREPLFRTLDIVAYYEDETTEKLLDVFNQSGSDLSTYVKSLTITDVILSRDLPRQARNVFSELKPFSSLTRLSLYSVALESWPEEAQTWVSTSLCNVENLLVEEVRFKSLTDMFALLSGAERLKHLSLAAAILRDPRAEPNLHILPPALKSLFFEDVQRGPDVINWLCQRPTVRDLTVDNNAYRMDLLLSSYLTVLGLVLEHLKISIGHYQEGSSALIFD